MAPWVGSRGREDDPDTVATASNLGLALLEQARRPEMARLLVRRSGRRRVFASFGRLFDWRQATEHLETSLESARRGYVRGWWHSLGVSWGGKVPAPCSPAAYSPKCPNISKPSPEP